MKAVVYHRYGGPDVVSLADLPKPTPKPTEVLVRIHATTITSGDWRARSLNLPAGFGLIGRLMFGVFGPRKPVLGTELSGMIESVGAKVTQFTPGDEIFAFPSTKFGGHAQYATMPADGMIALKPGNLTFAQAAALSFGGTTALDFLRDKAQTKPGDRILIVGASGGVGTAAIQIAKHLGAHVTGVTSTGNMALVEQLGADEIIDYTQADFAKGADRFDIILDTTGTTTMARVARVLNAGGRLLPLIASFNQMLGLDNGSKKSGKKTIAGVASERPEDLRTLAQIASAGNFTPVIDRAYPLDQAATAHALVDTGRKRGNVVLQVISDG